MRGWSHQPLLVLKLLSDIAAVAGFPVPVMVDVCLSVTVHG